MTKVYVTGLGFISSIGNSTAEVLDSLIHLRTGIEPYPPLAPANIPIKLAGTIKGFDTQSLDSEDWTYPAEYKPSRNLLRNLSAHGLYCYCAINQAIQSSGLRKEDISNERTGLYTASIGSVSSLRYHLNRLWEVGADKISPKAVISSVPGTLNFNFVAHLGIKGSSCGFVSACASSGHALGSAWDEIATGRQDIMLVVGGEDGDPDTILPFASMRALATGSDPKEAVCPFDKRRSGFVATGGGVAMILESEASMKARGARPLAEMLSWAQTSDGFSPVLPDPEGNGVERSMRMAIDRAGLTPDAIDYLNAHAPSTFAGDLAEMKAIKKVFGSGAHVKVSSTKSLTGHGLSMSSIIEAAISVLSIDTGYCPGTAHLRDPDPEADGIHLLFETEKTDPRYALSNSSGFGGANVSLLFGKP